MTFSAGVRDYRINCVVVYVSLLRLIQLLFDDVTERRPLFLGIT